MKPLSSPNDNCTSLGDLQSSRQLNVHGTKNDYRKNNNESKVDIVNEGIGEKESIAVNSGDILPLESKHSSCSLEKPSPNDFSTHFVIHRHSPSKSDFHETPSTGKVFETNTLASSLTSSSQDNVKANSRDDIPQTVKSDKIGAPCEIKQVPLATALPEKVFDWTTTSKSPDKLAPMSLANTSPNARRLAAFKHPFMGCKLQLPEALRRPQQINCLSSVKLPCSPMDCYYEPISAYCIQDNDIRSPRDIHHNLKNFEFEQRKPLEKILETCSQRCPIPIELIFNDLRNVKKIGEGVYGEVYSANFRCMKEYTWVYKVVAIEGDAPVNGERQKKFMEILPEIMVSHELNQLHSGLRHCRTTGYVHMRNARIAVGKYPVSLVMCWEKYHDEYESDNDKPNKFSDDQLYMILEFEFAGKDIESINFRDARQSLSVVLQVAHILAAGEKALEFEHRDLHWGNIMVDTWKTPNIEFVLDGVSMLVPARGVKVVVIDFTMARLKNANNSVICLDLQDDDEQFLGTGDHQFDIYRMMKDYNRNDWQKYSPKSNIFWLHYLAHKFSLKGQYASKEDDDGRALDDNETNSFNSDAMREVIKLSHSIFQYESASQFVRSQECEEYKRFLKR